MSRKKPPALPPAVIEAADALADVRDELETAHAAARDALREVISRHSRHIQNLTADLDAARGNLIDQAEANIGLFTSPRTRTHRGIKFGLHKMPEKLIVTNQSYTIERIRRDFDAETAASMVKTTEKVQISALRRFPPESLHALGIRVEGSYDQIYCQQNVDDFEKLIETILESISTGEDDS